MIKKKKQGKQHTQRTQHTSRIAASERARWHLTGLSQLQKRRVPRGWPGAWLGALGGRPPGDLVGGPSHEHTQTGSPGTGPVVTFGHKAPSRSDQTEPARAPRLCVHRSSQACGGLLSPPSVAALGHLPDAVWPCTHGGSAICHRGRTPGVRACLRRGCVGFGTRMGGVPCCCVLTRRRRRQMGGVHTVSATYSGTGSRAPRTLGASLFSPTR